MEKSIFQRCSRCVMDTTDPEITFNSEGICNHCTSLLLKKEEIKQLRKISCEHLQALVAKIKREGKNNKYDVLLGISGGVDSCYVAYLLKQLGIRTLLVHMDNGWNSDHAILNIRNVAARLNFDYESFVLDWEEFKDIQLAFLKASVVEAETPTDVAILGCLHKVASQNNIKFIISGGNLATEGILPAMWHYNAKDTIYFNHIQKTFGSKKLKTFPDFSFAKEMYYKFIRGIRMIYLLNYFDYNKSDAMKILEKELHWKNYGGKHHESRFTKFIQSYLLPKKFNLDYRKATFSSLICDGKMTREDALEALQEPMYCEETLEKEKEYIAKKLGISVCELTQIINLPGKYYYQYPNDEKRLRFIYKVYKKYFSK